MEILDAKNNVINAGIKLLESGLVSRTWGNVSAREDSNSFVITPSGREYQTLTDNEIVEVKIKGCSYNGNIKPSSEKAVHAAVYELFEKVCFVIHTHQEYASIVSTLNVDGIFVKDKESILNGHILCADYALPSTKRLARKIRETLLKTKVNAVIMKNHGALCFGENAEEAFAISGELEKVSKEFVTKYYKISDSENTFDIVNLGIPFHHIKTPAVMEMSKRKGFGVVRPLIDDFAQIAGDIVKIVKPEKDKILKALEKQSLVFVKDNGAICSSKSESDMNAISQIAEKNCKCIIAAKAMGKVKYINPIECKIMRINYLKNYSKMNTENIQ